MEWEDYLKLYDEFPEDERVQDEEPQCEHDFVMENLMVCQKCGFTDDKPLFIENIEAKKARYYDYARVIYFVKRLRYMNRHVQCTLPEYNDIILKLSERKFETLLELKKIMKELKLAKWYRYLYSIFYDIKKKKAIQMNHAQIENMTKLFIKIEREFENQFPGKRNMVSYNVMFYYIFQFYGIDNSALILPKNKNRIGRIIENILANIKIFSPINYERGKN